MLATRSTSARRHVGPKIVRGVVSKHRTTLNQPSTNSYSSIANKSSPGSFTNRSTEARAIRLGFTSLLSQLSPQPVKSSSLNVSVRQSHTSITSSERVAIGNRQFSAVYLRDACTCPLCVDPSSKQKNFQTTDIPPGIQAKTVEPQTDGSVKVRWVGDLAGFGDDHASIFSAEFFDINSSWDKFHQDHFGMTQPSVWDKSTIAEKLQHVDYEDYITQDAALYRVLQQLHNYGLALLRGVPESEKSVESIAGRIGRLRDTFYGRTWDVKSVPQAKNVAYTAQYLGLHMDLLYMRDPPGFQFLHCLKNSCKGGSSLFSDSFYAASKLSKSSFEALSSYQVPYHYRNAGEHYYYSHPVIELKSSPGEPKTIDNVNYSPPFQATLAFPTIEEQQLFDPVMKAWRELASGVENEENLYEYRLQEGECVIFNNRRVLHGRRQFDTSAGERWLKGCYLDTDVFMSRYRVLSEVSANGKMSPN